MKTVSGILAVFLLLAGCAPGSLYVPIDSLQEKVMAPFRPAPPDRQAVVYPREAGAP